MTAPTAPDDVRKPEQYLDERIEELVRGDDVPAYIVYERTHLGIFEPQTTP